MNKDQLIGKWDQFKGEALRQWGRLTDDQLDQINGDRIKLAGLIRENYGVTKEEAEKQVERFIKEHDRADV